MKNEMEFAYEVDFPTSKKMKQNTQKLKNKLIHEELESLRNRMMAATDTFIEVPRLSDTAKNVLINLGYTISTVNSPIGIATRTGKFIKISWSED